MNTGSSPQKEKIYHVAIAADRNFSVPLALTAYSILKNRRPDQPYHIHVLGADIEERVANEIRKMCDGYQCGYSYHDVNELLKGVMERKHFPAITFGRFLLPELLPQDVDVALYLDADIMLCGEIESLFELDMGDYYLAGVQDIGYSAHPCFSDHIKELREYYGLTEETMPIYYNAGQLVMNLRAWRRDGLGEKCLHMGRNPVPILRYQDQDIINVLCAGKVKTLPLRYSVAPHFFHVYKRMADGTLDETAKSVYSAQEATEAMANPVLYHFLTCSKPFVLYPPICGYKSYYKLWRSSRWKHRIPFTPEKFKKLALEMRVKKYRFLYSLMLWLCYVPFGYELWWTLMKFIPVKQRADECWKLEWVDPAAAD